MEYFDVLDCTGKKTGETILRDEAHRKGVWHGAFHCVIIYQRDGRGYALFQLRSREKKIAPGKFDVSVGGHYAAGEAAEDAGPREIREELGLLVAFSSLLPVGRRIFVYCFTPGLREYEFQDIFLLPADIRPETLTPQRSEVDAVLELEIEKGIGLFSGMRSAVDGRLFRRDGSETDTVVSPVDFVPCLDNYYLKLLILARRYFSGERDILVI